MASSPSPTYTGLYVLNQALTDYLLATDICPGLKVDCVEHAGRLFAIGQHLAPEVGDPQALLNALEGAFEALMPTLGLADSPWAEANAMPVRIYLKLKAARQPYAMHTFTWRVEDAAPMVFPSNRVNENPVNGGAVNGTPVNGGAVNGTSVDGSLVNETLMNGNSANETLTNETVSLDGEGNPLGAEELGQVAAVGSGDDQGSTQLPNPANPPFNEVALALPETAIQPPLVNPWQEQGQRLGGQMARWMRYYWSYGVAALILLGSGAFAYALTRPCVVGSCDRIDKAEEFYGLAEATLLTSPSGDDILAAETDLQSAIEILAPIPTWSGYYETAQTNLQRYRRSSTALKAITQSQSLAAQAANLSQNPPHPVERWVNVHLLWQQAIDRLDTVPAENPAFDYAQKKRSEYRANHSAIGRRIVAEEEAEANFNTAIQTGQLARQRMETANSLAGWQLATKEWQAAIKGLSLIPQGTMVYAEAQAQLQDYQQSLLRSTNRAHLEEASAHNYNQAVQAARAAAAYEAKNQWTLAVTHWQRAVASAQQIPADTLLSGEGAQLLETYQPALTNAQNRLRTTVALQGLTATLGEMCAYDASPCTVREDPSQVQVVLTSQYAEPLRQAITPPATDGTFAFTNELSPNVQRLLDQIITFSHQADRQVAIYDSRGGFVARYRPDLGGFIKN
jgi:hypothetical protein